MKTGRPTFQIDAKRLAELRRENGLTQGALVKRAYELLGKPKVQSLRTKISHYQKIERRGRTSEPMARVLAQVLGVKVEVLQGDAPDDAPAAVDQIERQLLSQLALGTNTALTTRLSQRQDGQDFEDDGQRVRSLAVDIAGHLEQLQFGQRSGDMAHLAELTGWPEAKLTEPLSFHGYWLLRDSMGASPSAEILLGVSMLMIRLDECFKRASTALSADAVLSIREELPWFYVDILDPRTTRLRTFSFLRCNPSGSGLQWVNPNWCDRLFLDEPLVDWAWKSANFVVAAGGQKLPRDARRLRLLVQEHSPAGEPLRHVRLLAGDIGCLGDLPEDEWAFASAQGSSHELAMDHLARGLWEDLLPLFSPWPLNAWEVRHQPEPLARHACIEFVLKAPTHLASPRGQSPFYGTKYILMLVEATDDEPFVPVPWRSASVEKVTAMLSSRLADEAARQRQGALLHSQA